MRNALAAALLVLVASPAVAGPPTPKKAPPATTPAPAAGTPAPTVPVGKTPPACGVKIFPLVVGNSWTYGPVAAPAPAPDPITRIAPIEPKTVTITVKNIDAKKGGDTTISLEEKVSIDLSKDPKKPQLDERVVNTTIVCNATHFDISPESFLFAGEPGGMIGMAIDKVDRKNTTWKVAAGLLGDGEWRDDMTAMWSRPPTTGSEAPPASGKLELERAFTPSQTELIVTKLGSFKAEKLFLKTTGRITLDGAPPDMKPMELPDNWVTTFWLSDGLGPVQVLNSYAHMYQLVDAKLN